MGTEPMALAGNELGLGSHFGTCGHRDGVIVVLKDIRLGLDFDLVGVDTEDFHILPDHSAKREQLSKRLGQSHTLSMESAECNIGFQLGNPQNGAVGECQHKTSSRLDTNGVHGIFCTPQTCPVYVNVTINLQRSVKFE